MASDVIMAGDIRNGIIIDLEGQLYQTTYFQHVKPGKGAAFVRTKLKNIVSGSTIEKTFNPSEKLNVTYVERRDMQYLYGDEDLFHFMDCETFEQLPIHKTTIGESLKFVKENEVVKVLLNKGSVLGIEPPTFVELVITYTEPGFKGDTATGANKPATVETGAIVKVPLFVEQGDTIKIDTRTGEYVERV